MKISSENKNYNPKQPKPEGWREEGTTPWVKHLFIFALIIVVGYLLVINFLFDKVEAQEDEITVVFTEKGSFRPIVQVLDVLVGPKSKKYFIEKKVQTKKYPKINTLRVDEKRVHFDKDIYVNVSVEIEYEFSSNEYHLKELFDSYDPIRGFEVEVRMILPVRLAILISAILTKFNDAVDKPEDFNKMIKDQIIYGSYDVDEEGKIHMFMDNPVRVNNDFDNFHLKIRSVKVAFY